MDEIFDVSFRKFLTRERPQIAADVSERNLCGRLAIYLEEAKTAAGLEHYHADTEYNRKQDGRVKTIINGEQQVITIVCDLILHSRGEIVKRDNLIAIEMKKSNRPQIEKDLDRDRLVAMTMVPYEGVWSADGKVHPEHVCGYELGVFVELNVARAYYTVEKFKLGRLVGSHGGNI